jgi:pilus assembly protein CpaC
LSEKAAEEAGSRPLGLEEKAATFALAEFFQLGPDPDIDRVKEVYMSRANILQVLQLEPNARVVKAIGKALGTVRVTVVGQNNRIRVYTVTITPSVAYLRERLRQQFPDANVHLTAVGDRIFLVEGAVEVPDQVLPIIRFLQGFNQRDGQVINAIKVTGVMQVQLEVVIAKVDRTAVRRMGINLLEAGVAHFYGNQQGNLAGVPTIAARGGTIGNASGVFTNFTGSNTTAVLSPDSTFYFGVTELGQSLFGFIELLKTRGHAKILARPTLVTLNGRPADFLVGGEQPVPIVSSSGGNLLPNVDYKPFGTRLTFVPIVMGEGKVRLNVIPEVSRVTAETVNVGGTQVPRFETQRVSATVEMLSGQTLALGGLLQTEVEDNVDAVPVLGELRYVGALFRRITHTKIETELVVLVTPQLVDPLRGCQKPAMLPGDESRNPTDCELYLKGYPEVPVDYPNRQGGKHAVPEVPTIPPPPPEPGR